MEEILTGAETAPRNPIIARAFRLAGWAELAGSGMLKIIAQWKEAGFVEPVIENNVPRGWFTLTLPFEETTQEMILRFIREKPAITRNELATKCGITPDGIKYHLDKLRNSGTIRHVGPAKGGFYEVLKD